MDQKTILKILTVIIVLGVLFALFAKKGHEVSPTVDENLQGNTTDETRKVNDEISDEKPRSIAFEHTNPGVSSEVYYTVGNLEPGTTFRATLYRDIGGLDITDGIGMDKEVTVDEFGVARFVWEINQFGRYGTTDQEWGYDVLQSTVTVE